MAGLSLQELYALNSILCGDHSQTLEQVSHEFRRSLLQQQQANKDKSADPSSSVDRRLRLGLAVSSLLNHADLLPTAAHRIVAVYLLCVELNPVAPPLSNGVNSPRPELAAYLESNPFVALALDLLDSPERTAAGEPPTRLGQSSISLPRASEVTPIEREFLVHLLSATAGPLLAGKTAGQLARFEMPPSNEAARAHVAQLRRAVAGRLAGWRAPVGSVPDVGAPATANVRCGLPALVDAPQAGALDDPQYTEQKATLAAAEALLVASGGPSSSCTGDQQQSTVGPPLALAPDTSAFRPRSVLPAPPLAPLAGDELVWLEWDESDFDCFKPVFYVPTEQELSGGASKQSASGTANLQPEAVMRRALITQLQLAESNFLIEQLRADGGRGLKLLETVDMSPDKLPKLVEDNPMVAVEVLMQLLPSEHVTDYFAALINMELSVHGLEVVNLLCSQVMIPEEFLHVYVTQCIQACESMRQQPFTQNRLVRMVCVFLSSLIRNGLIRVRDLHVELQAFCISFNSVKEAAALYQTIQMMNQEERSKE